MSVMECGESMCSVKIVTVWPVRSHLVSILRPVKGLANAPVPVISQTRLPRKTALASSLSRMFM
jgi:hypothetical protein